MRIILFGFVERQSGFAFFGAAISVAAFLIFCADKTVMILNCKDAIIFALLDLNCFLEKVLTEDSKVFTKKAYDKNSYLPSYALVSF